MVTALFQQEYESSGTSTAQLLKEVAREKRLLECRVSVLLTADINETCKDTHLLHHFDPLSFMALPGIRLILVSGLSLPFSLPAPNIITAFRARNLRS